MRLSVRRLAMILSLLVATACGDGGEEIQAAGGAAGAAGAAGSTGCEPGERPDGDDCLPAGIPPEQCAEGFEPDGAQSCVPIMPAGGCPPGEMAIPGETECRLVAPCPAGPWPDGPLDGTTQYVDQSYQGGGSDGTEQAPWLTIADAWAAAAPGAIIAVTDGTYVEDVTIQSKPIRLWGRCPGAVTLSGSAAALATVFIRAGADGTELRDLAITGDTIGVGLSGSVDVLLDRVWIHDTPDRGILAQSDLGPTGIDVERSLVESATEIGAFLEGTVVTIDRSVVRGTRPIAGRAGRGVSVQESHLTSTPSILLLRSSVIEANHELGVFVGGSEATIEATLVRDTRPTFAGQEAGHGIEGQASPLNGQRANLIVRGSVVERSHEGGIVLHGTDAVIESTVVRDTLPRGADDLMGWGISAEVDLDSNQRSTLELRSSVAERNSDVGISVLGCDGVIESVVSRLTQPVYDSSGGRGMNVQVQPITSEPAIAAVRWCLIEGNTEAGITVFGSSAEIEATAIRDTAARSTGILGDGLAVVSYLVEADATLSNSLLQTTTRAAVLNTAASVSIAGTSLECNTIDLDGEPGDMGDYDFEDAGDNACGCDGQEAECRIVSSGLEPPTPL